MKQEGEMVKKYFYLVAFLFSCVVFNEIVPRAALRKPSRARGVLSNAMAREMDFDAEVVQETEPLMERMDAPKKPARNLVGVAAVEEPEMTEPTGEVMPEVDVDEAAITVDSERRIKAIQQLVERGIAYLKNNDTEEALSLFTHVRERGKASKFVDGEISLIVFDEDGVCLAHPDRSLVWKNLFDYRDMFGTPVVRKFIQTGLAGGGFMTYHWRGATQVVYAKALEKGKQKFIVGAGFYPHSKKDQVVSLVKGAVASFNEGMKQKKPPAQVFSDFSYPLGSFISGDLYLYALDFEGMIVAQGERPGLIGQNALLRTDAAGKPINKVLIDELKTKPEGEGVWIDYLSKNAPKKAYAEKVKDQKGNFYFIACGYYPESNRKKVVELVRRGYQYLKSHGETQAQKEFSFGRDFLDGDLYLSVYDTDGKVIADGANEDLIGTKRLNIKDEDGRYYVQEMIAKAQTGGGWISYRFKNAYKSAFVDKIVELGTKNYIITAGIYPVSKREKTSLLVKGAAGLLKTQKPRVLFERATDKEGEFVRGDLSLFVFDTAGICFVYGDNYSLIWRNLIRARDGDDKPLVRRFIEASEDGPGWLEYTDALTKRKKVAYVQREQGLDGQTYVLGSSFYK